MDKNAVWWTLFSQIDQVSVVHLDLSPDEALESQAQKWLNPEELARRERYLHAPSKRRFTLCRAALRAILCGELGCENHQLAFEISHHGKPRALVDGANAPISFNLSHSGEHGLIATAPEGRIGVDVQERSPRHDLDGRLQTVFAPKERIELARAQGADKAHLFFSLWTMKEALVKALGRGISWDFSKFEIPQNMHRNGSSSTYYFPQMPEVKWQLQNLGNQHFAAALAFELDSNKGSILTMAHP